MVETGVVVDDAVVETGVVVDDAVVDVEPDEVLVVEPDDVEVEPAVVEVANDELLVEDDGATVDEVEAEVTDVVDPEVEVEVEVGPPVVVVVADDDVEPPVDEVEPAVDVVEPRVVVVVADVAELPVVDEAAVVTGRPVVDEPAVVAGELADVADPPDVDGELADVVGRRAVEAVGSAVAPVASLVLVEPTGSVEPAPTPARACSSGEVVVTGCDRSRSFGIVPRSADVDVELDGRDSTAEVVSSRASFGVTTTTARIVEAKPTAARIPCLVRRALASASAPIA